MQRNIAVSRIYSRYIKIQYIGPTIQCSVTLIITVATKYTSHEIIVTVCGYNVRLQFRHASLFTEIYILCRTFCICMTCIENFYFWNSLQKENYIIRPGGQLQQVSQITVQFRMHANPPEYLANAIPVVQIEPDTNLYI